MSVDHEALMAMLDRLKLTAIRDQLDPLLEEAARSDMTLREALAFFVEREIARRDERRIQMASKIAQFPFVRAIDGFEFDAQPSVNPRQIRELAECRWIAHGDAVLFLWPPGTGKSHLAVALEREAIQRKSETHRCGRLRRQIQRSLRRLHHESPRAALELIGGDRQGLRLREKGRSGLIKRAEPETTQAKTETK